MAKRRMDVINRPNTLEENKLVLRDLRTRNKIEHRNLQELSKLFTKLNTDASSKNSQNAKISLSTRQEKTTAEHPYGPLEGFPVGSWWGIRMDCSRDRIHNPFNKDVQEGPFGAVSLCTSHLNTNDVDLGDSLTFTGSKYESGVKSDDPLLQSYHSQVPFRLVRSYNLNNNYAPKTGYRYDGLYTVAAYWIGVTCHDEKNYKFALVRLRNQDPPPWHDSNRMSIKTAHSSRQSSGPQTRYSNDRFSTNLCGETCHPANDQETIKLSFKKSSLANATEKNAIESKKNLHDSAIVTRCIFNKKIECPSSSTQPSVPFVESTINSAKRHLENLSKPPCTLQNTNISIRTDLYESYLHQEPVKVTPMTFCRTYKSPRALTHIIKHSNVGPLNLNSCGPCPKDKEQASQIQSRSGVGKFSSTYSPCSESNRSGDRSTPNNYRSVGTPTEAKTSHDDRTMNAINTENVEPAELPKSSISEKSKEKRQDQKRRDKENSPERAPNSVFKSLTGTTEKTEAVCPITGTKSEENVEASAMNRNESIEGEVSEESHGALDSLAPDQMLNFIVEQKYHPTAKLLIGSVIGLATGESTILRAYDSLISGQNCWNRSQSLRSTQNETTIDPHGIKVQSAESSFKCRQGSNRPPRKNQRSPPKTISKKRMMEERMMQMRLRRTRVSKRTQGTEKKSLTKPSESMSQRLRKSKITDKTQQPFSKSTTMKKSTKRAKKRGGELARLVIDANIGPKIRGPRNRRLRGMTNIFAMRCSAGQKKVSACCSGNNSDEGLKGKKGNTGVKLSSRKSKRLNPATKSRISQSHFMEQKKMVQKNERMPRSGFEDGKNTKQEAEIINLDRRYRRQNVINPKTAAASAATSSLSLSSKGTKRRMSRTRSSSRERISGARSTSNKRLCCHPRSVSEIRNRMVDAATQCSDRRDAATSVEKELEPMDQRKDRENSIKVEWIDLDDVKSETHECLEERSDLESETRGYSAIKNLRENADIITTPMNPIPIRPQATKPRINVPPRLSAFVPVNLSDSDFRIARLRSIGFRPIEPAIFTNDKDPLQSDEQVYASGSSQESEHPTVVSRTVDEQYNKYTCEETDVVEYMDHELRYQDIEEEEVVAVRKNRGRMSKRGSRTMKNEKIGAAKSGKIEVAKGQRVSGCIEDDSEEPWHGWKKFIKNKKAHWIGW